MKNLKKLLSLLLALVMLLSVLAGCTGNEDTQPSEGTQASTDGTTATEGTTVPAAEDPARFGGHLDVAYPSALTTLDPLKQTGTWKYMWTTCVWENPLNRDADGNIAPGVCDYTISEDKLVLTLWVRDGMLFHNGDTVDINDVKASIDRALVLRDNMKDKVAPYIAGMEVDEATGKLTITFTEYRDNCYYYLAAYQTWCAVMPKELCEKYPDSLFGADIADCIGTGPYYISDFVEGTHLELTKFADYVPQKSEYTGFAATKYGYMDSITFWQNKDESSRSIAVLSGDYDISECLTEEYRTSMEQSGVVMTNYPNNVGLAMTFNTFGVNNVCAKYPSLRKAVMAAIDYESFLDVISDGSQIMGGQPVLDAVYETDAFETADYYGAANMDVVSKYVEAAKAEGWDGVAPVVCYSSPDRSDIITLVNDYLTKAGIPVEVAQMEATALAEFKLNPENIWDMVFFWPTFTNAPSQLGEDILNTYWNSEDKDAVLEIMSNNAIGTDAYVDAWNDLTEVWVDECAVAYMGMKAWRWFHDQDLVTNDTDVVQRHFFNAYWTDPSAHMD